MSGSIGAVTTTGLPIEAKPPEVRPSLLEWVGTFAAWGLAAMLAISSLIHIQNPYAFLDTVHSYQILGYGSGKWVAAILPFVQLLCGVALVYPGLRREGWILGVVLFGTFIVAQTMVLSRGMQIPCGCFGLAEQRMIGTATLATSVVGFVLCLIGAVGPRFFKGTRGNVT